MKTWLTFVLLLFPVAAPLPVRDAHALLWLPDGRLLLGHHDGVLQSTAPFQKWTSLIQQEGLDAMNLASTKNGMLLAGHNVYGNLSSKGVFQAITPRGLTGMDFHQYTVTPEKHYAQVMGDGMVVSVDGGKTWKPAPELPMDTYRMLGTPKGVILVSDSKGISGLGATPTLPAPVMNLHQDTLGRLWIATLQGVYVLSRNQWQQVSKTPALLVSTSPKNPGEGVLISNQGEAQRVKFK